MHKRAVVAAFVLAGCCGAGVAADESPSLWPQLAELRARSFVDLTHGFEPGIPHWSGFEPERRELIYDYAPGAGTRGHGFRTWRHCLPGQWGTHVDAPAHFVPGARTVDEIPVTEMLLPLVVIDVSGKVAADSDYRLRRADVLAWERRHGPVPAGAFVAMRSDWSKRWPDPARMRNADAAGVAHYPGWSRAALVYLIEERAVSAIGHEPTDTDPGTATSAGDYGLEAYVLGRDRWQIEMLANLDRVPEYGAVVVAAFPRPLGGTGFPARVFAILPPER
ncbi:MAG: cyclase family protein [Gammaproteobacteria bacterium]|nr:cyclase family protein [Gammaproteobacteria bacterium]